MVFLELNRWSLERYWIPTVFGDAGRPVAAAFEQSAADLWRIVDRVLDATSKNILLALIAQWKRNNPDQYRVEGVRLTTFAARKGELATKQAAQASGLLKAVKRATLAADDVVLLGERAMSFVNRLPFLLRMQARVGVREVLADSAAAIDTTHQLVTEAESARPLVRELSGLMARAGETTREVRLLVGQVKHHDGAEPPSSAEFGARAAPKVPVQVQTQLDSANALADKILAIVQELARLAPGSSSDPMRAAIDRIDALLRRSAFYAFALGTALTVVWWTGYIVAKRTCRRSPGGSE